jgi:geranylgeranyl pyrophosphate synthase
MNNQPLFDDFEAEIQEVQSTLLEATNDLTSPLGDLVRAQIKRSQPPICGAVVLAVAKPASLNQETTEAEAELHHKRILLAAALEMLHVALNVHRLLVNAALREQQREQHGGNDSALDLSFIGSTILAGDYCFSRAAQMAAQTDHPRVVATFALALQTVSEGLLREQFHGDDGLKSIHKDEYIHAQWHDGDREHAALMDTERYRNGNYDETRQLLHSGAHAAALLVGLSESEQEQAIALSHELASHWALDKQGVADENWQEVGSWAEALPASWQTLHQWLNHQRANGESPT